ncbi:MAG: hypothetical protein LBG98_03365 [Puniceicoccales bacterium]|jgi:hypothetical protein|nr:hypothetical protein [Puniceicoccales bacterium]
MNKKLFTAAVGISFAAFLRAEEGSNADEVNFDDIRSIQGSPLSLNVNIRFDSEDTTFGCKGVKRSPFFTEDISVIYPFSDSGKIYVGNENDLYLKDASFNSHSFYLGSSYGINDLFTADLRYTYTLIGGGRKIRQETRSEGKKDHRHALRALVKANTFLKPSLAYTYNLTLRRSNIKSTIGHTFDLASLGINKFSVNLGAHLGYAHTQRPSGKKGLFETGGDFNGWKKGWLYYGANTDLVYAYNENVSASVGVNYQGANQKKAYLLKKGRKNAVWGSCSISCAF